MPIFLEGLFRPLLIVHALLAGATLGACIHLSSVAVQLLRGRHHLARLARVYSLVIGATFLVVFVVGLLIYPAFRYHVRAVYLDSAAPWASNLFDIKENLAALGLPLCMALLAVGRRFDPKTDGALLPALVYFSLSLCALVGFAVGAGLLVTMVRAV